MCETGLYIYIYLPIYLSIYLPLPPPPWIPHCFNAAKDALDSEGYTRCIIYGPSYRHGVKPSLTHPPPPRHVL